MNLIKKVADKVLPSNPAVVPTTPQQPIPEVNAAPTQSRQGGTAPSSTRPAPDAAAKVVLAPTAMPGQKPNPRVNAMTTQPQMGSATAPPTQPGLVPNKKTGQTDVGSSSNPHNTESAVDTAVALACELEDLAKPQPPAEAELSVSALAQLPLDPNTTCAKWNIVNIGYGRENASIRAIDGIERLVVNYPMGSINPGAPGRPTGGLGFYASPKAVFPALDLELRYRLAFAPTFDPRDGGKLPGIFLTDPACSKTDAGSGGRFSDHMASLRLMWRADMQAEAYVYATAAHSSPEYLQLPSSHFNPEYGDSVWRGLVNFRKEGWNDVRLRVKLNTLGKNNGTMMISVNDSKLVFDKMCWRRVGDMVVAAVFFSTFYGGSSERFACPCDTQIHFADFRVKRFS